MSNEIDVDFYECFFFSPFNFQKKNKQFCFERTSDDERGSIHKARRSHKNAPPLYIVRMTKEGGQ